MLMKLMLYRISKRETRQMKNFSQACDALGVLAAAAID